MVTQESSTPQLRDYLGVLRRRRAAIGLAVGVVTAAALISSLIQTPVYSATASVLLQTRSTESPFDPSTGQRNDPQRQVDTEMQLIQSQPVKAAVKKELGVAPDVSVQPRAQTDVISIKGESTIPKRAADVANAYATAYTDFRRKQAVDDVLSAAQQIQDKSKDLQKQIDVATGAQKETLIQQQALFKQKLDELQVDAALKTGGAQLVTEAVVPSTPTSPRPVRNVALGILVGSILGIGLAFVIEHLDDSVKNKDDLGRATGGLPVIGLIPAVAGWKLTDAPKLISFDDPRAPASEAYRTLRTSIQFLTLERPIRTLQVTSPSAQEGKTTTLANIGVALARAGQHVVIVDCDLRRPRVHEFFDLDNTMGFSSVLLGKVPLSAAVQEVPGQQRLSLLASGPLPPNPSELLSSKRTIEVLTSLQAQADVVLIDSTPVLPVTDALVLSGRVDGTLLVCVAGATTRKDAARAVELLQQVEAPLVGTVLNGVSAEGGYGYDYGYYSRYEQSSGDRAGAKPRGGTTQPDPVPKR